MLFSKKKSLKARKKNLSLLWPGDYEQEDAVPKSNKMDKISCHDIELERLLAGFEPHGKELNHWMEILRNLCSDTRVIEHRQMVFNDLYHNSDLAELMGTLLPDLQALKSVKSVSKEDSNLIFMITSRLAELDGLGKIVNSLLEFFESHGDQISSQVFCELHRELKSIAREPQYNQMMSEVPQLLEQLRDVASVTIGVNLNPHLQPVEATLVSVNREKYTLESDNVINRLLGKKISDFKGLVQLHSVPKKQISTGRGMMALDEDVHGYAVSPMMVPLFKDLNEVLKKTIIPINKALTKYGNIRGDKISSIADEVPFFLAGLRMIKKFEKAGLPVCAAKILDSEKRITRLKEAYNPNLALAFLNQGENGKLASPVVLNHVEISEKSRVQIITGPNQGGKTTYIQAVALSHLLFQAGFFVPASEAAMSPVDCLCTHFPTEEKIDRGRGRLGDEAHRFSKQFEILTSQSLFLLNESFSSTYSGESLYMAQDILKILLKLGTRSLFATHLHELAANFEDINRETSTPDRCISLVSQVCDQGEDRRTYQLVPGPPLGHSYAREIAEKFGIAYDQLDETLKKRGVLK